MTTQSKLPPTRQNPRYLQRLVRLALVSRMFRTYEPDPVGEVLGTGYCRFTTQYGLNGLARVDGERLDVLAVIATEPGKGQFRRFIQEAKLLFSVVAVWEDWNPILGPVLTRYGFCPVQITEPWGEVSDGFQWSRPNTKLRDAAPTQPRPQPTSKGEELAP